MKKNKNWALIKLFVAMSFAVFLFYKLGAALLSGNHALKKKFLQALLYEDSGAINDFLSVVDFRKVWTFLSIGLFLLLLIFSAFSFYVIYKAKSKIRLDIVETVHELIRKLAVGQKISKDEELKEVEAEIRTLISQKKKAYDKNKEYLLEYQHSMSFLAHDLRSPLTSIKGYTAYLLCNDIKREEALKYLGIISEKADVMNNYIDEIMKLSKFHEIQETLKMQDLDLTELLYQIKSNFYPTITEKKLNFNIAIDEALYVKAEPELIARAFQNVIKNAVEHSDEGCDINIYRRKADEIVIENRAKEMNIKELEDIFKPFFRISAEDKGTGLGLSIARTIIERHGGKIFAESLSGVFRIVINLNIMS